MRRGGGRPGDKADLKYLGPLIRYLGRNRVRLFLAILFSMLGTVLTIIGPKYVSKIADLITAGFTGDIDLHAVARIGLMLAGFYVLAWIFSFLQMRLMNVVTQSTSYGLRKDISRKIPHQNGAG